MEMYSNNSKYMFIFLSPFFLNISHVEMLMYYVIQINPLSAVGLICELHNATMTLIRLVLCLFITVYVNYCHFDGLAEFMLEGN